MKSRSYSVVALTAISLIIISGCVDYQQFPVNQSTGDDDPSINTTILPSSTPSVKPDPTKVSDTVNMSAFNWFEYRFKTSNGYLLYFKVIYDKQEYFGVLADHKNISNRMDDSGDTRSVTDLYYDDNGNFLGGSTIIYSTLEKGKPGEWTHVRVQNYTASDASTANGLDLICSIMINAPLTYMWTEIISIDGKSYQTKKYTCKNNDLIMILWYDPDVPMPVKFSYPSPDHDNSYELVGWG